MFNESGIPVLDAHIHIMGGLEGIEQLRAQKARYGYTSANVLSTQAMGDRTQNAKCIAYKLSNPGDYAFAGLDYTEMGFLSQACLMYRMGFDGFKMIEGKPDVRKRIGLALNDDIYDPFYSFLEEKGMPLLLHAADPGTFWDAEKLPAFAKEAGWFYGDGTYLTQNEIYDEVEGVLRKHPALKIILAHFYFMSDNMARAEQLFEEFPNLHFDITPGTEMFVDFTKNPEAARLFFNKYQDRIIFGTDNFDTDSEEEKGIKDVINNLLYMYLFTNEVFYAWDLKIQGIGLDREVLEKILHKNFRRITGAPRQADKKTAAAYCRNLIDSSCFSKEEKSLLGRVIEIAEDEAVK